MTLFLIFQLLHLHLHVGGGERICVHAQLVRNGCKPVEDVLEVDDIAVTHSRYRKGAGRDQNWLVWSKRWWQV